MVPSSKIKSFTSVIGKHVEPKAALRKEEPHEPVSVMTKNSFMVRVDHVLNVDNIPRGLDRSSLVTLSSGRGLSDAAGVYVTLHISGKEVLYRASLTELEQRLDPSRFLRIPRSAIVNSESIVQLEPLSHGEFEVLLRDGSHPRASRTYRAAMEKRLGQRL